MWSIISYKNTGGSNSMDGFEYSQRPSVGLCPELEHTRFYGAHL